ncbi:hypothetical protein HHI36_002773, partial [Cryptolaemus montrouzieri]
ANQIRLRIDSNLFEINIIQACRGLYRHLLQFCHHVEIDQPMQQPIYGRLHDDIINQGAIIRHPNIVCVRPYEFKNKFVPKSIVSVEVKIEITSQCNPVSPVFVKPTKKLIHDALEDLLITRR